jgi:hypothetical protein
MASFNFTERLTTGKNGSKSINAILTSFIAAIAAYIDAILSAGVDTENLTDGAVTADKLDAGAVTTEKVDAEAITGNKLSSTCQRFFYITGGESTSAAVDLTATGGLSTDRIVTVLDVTAKNVVDKTWFAPGDDIITQEIGHDLHTSSLLFVVLADES